MPICILHTPTARAICRFSSVPLLIALLLAIFQWINGVQAPGSVWRFLGNAAVVVSFARMCLEFPFWFKPTNRKPAALVASVFGLIVVWGTCFVIYSETRSFLLDVPSTTYDSAGWRHFEEPRAKVVQTDGEERAKADAIATAYRSGFFLFMLGLVLHGFILSRIERRLFRLKKMTIGPVILLLSCWPDHRGIQRAARELHIFSDGRRSDSGRAQTHLDCHSRRVIDSVLPDMDVRLDLRRSA